MTRTLTSQIRASIEESRNALNARALTLLQQLLALPPLPPKEHVEHVAAQKVASEASASRAVSLDSLEDGNVVSSHRRTGESALNVLGGPANTRLLRRQSRAARKRRSLEQQA